jgi:hypothetical protein
MGVLPQLEVAAAGLLPYSVLGGMKERKEGRHVLGGKGHADNSDEHSWEAGRLGSFKEMEAEKAKMSTH